MNRIRRHYGAHPLQLLIVLGCFALAGYVAVHVATNPLWPLILVWFLAAVIGHDLVAFPLYALADLVLARTAGRLAPRAPVPVVNYLRIPLLGAGLTFALFLPGIIQQGAFTYHTATGLTQQPFLGRWLLLCAAMFGTSAVVYAIRSAVVGRRLAVALRPIRPLLAADEQVLATAFAPGGAAGAVASSHALYHPAESTWARLPWAELTEVSWARADRRLLVTGHPGEQRLALPVADPGELVQTASSQIALAGLGGPGAPVRPTARPVGRGALAGLVSGVLVAAVLAGHDLTGWPGLLGYAAYATVLGAVLGAASGGHRAGPAVLGSGGLLLGGLSWLGYSLTLVPLLHGHAPTWSVTAASAAYPDLVGDVLQGGLTGVLLTVLLATGLGRARQPRRAMAAPARARVVIVGGGFAGVSAARRFERLALRGAPVDVTLVSDSNFLLFTPMLAEAAAGAVAGQHISAPVRSAVAHTRFRHGTVLAVDAAERTVALAVGATTETIGYDHLVLAAGSTAHGFGLPGVAEHAWPLKNLGDATRLRDHVLGLLELAEQEADPAARRRLLTFVVAGAGFAGTELVAELFDLVHGVAHFYPGIGPADPRFALVHAGDRILPELSAELADYAARRLAARGIEIRLDRRVTEATADRVRLDDGTELDTHTLAWTAGNRPSQLATDLANTIGAGRVLATDAMLRVRGLDRVWAVGDCAGIPDPDHDGASYPPTAQHALREGRAVADNIAAVLAGRAPAEFRFRALGVLVALGHRTAVADLRGRRFAGFAAWLLWRGIYLAKLPGLEKRVRVLLDWLLDLGFARDIVVTTPPRRSAPEVEVDAR